MESQTEKEHEKTGHGTLQVFKGSKYLSPCAKVVQAGFEVRWSRERPWQAIAYQNNGNARSKARAQGSELWSLRFRNLGLKVLRGLGFRVKDT